MSSSTNNAAELKSALSGLQSTGNGNSKGPIICLGHTKPIPNIHYSTATADGYFLMSACLDGKPMMREGDSGDWIGTFIGHKGAVWCATLNSDATLCATASADYTVKVWDSVQGQCLMTLEQGSVAKVTAFSADSQRLFTAGKKKCINVYDISPSGRSSDTPVDVLVGHGETVSYIVPSPHDANLIITGADEKDLRVWDLTTKEVVKTLVTGAPVTDVSLSYDGSVLSATAGKVAYFFDAKTLALLKTFEADLPLKCVACCPPNEEGKTGEGVFVLGSEHEMESDARSYNYSTLEPLAVNKGHHGPVLSIAFDPTRAGKTYATGSRDGTIRIWD
jgi:serine-threonine kinase receptor-associated protein